MIKLRSLGSFALLALMACIGSANSDPLITGQSIDGSLLVRYSGEEVSWVACAAQIDPGDFAQFEMIELVSDQVVRQGSAPLAGNRFTFTIDVPRAGIYKARARSCFDGLSPPADRCSDWVESNDSSQPPASCVQNGNNYVYTIIAPPGAPEI